jgi:hypothetical protein
MDVGVCLSGADGRVVERIATLFRRHREVSRVRIPGRMGLDVVLCAFRVVQKKERRGEGGHHQRKKGKKLVGRKVPDRAIW